MTTRSLQLLHGCSLTIALASLNPATPLLAAAAYGVLRITSQTAYAPLAERYISPLLDKHYPLDPWLSKLRLFVITTLASVASCWALANLLSIPLTLSAIIITEYSALSLFAGLGLLFLAAHTSYAAYKHFNALNNVASAALKSDPLSLVPPIQQPLVDSRLWITG